MLALEKKKPSSVDLRSSGTPKEATGRGGVNARNCFSTVVGREIPSYMRGEDRVRYNPLPCYSSRFSKDLFVGPIDIIVILVYSLTRGDGCLAQEHSTSI